MDYRRFVWLLIIAIYGVAKLNAADTLIIRNPENIISLQDNIEVFEDKSKQLTISDISGPNYAGLFRKNSDQKINFGYSTSVFWIKFILSNKAGEPLDFILEVSNPDLDYIDFYGLRNDRMIKSVKTGELRPVNTRDLYHRNFSFQISLLPDETTTYYLSVNNIGHPCSVPMTMKSKGFFEREDKQTEIFNWLIYGLLIFMLIFNIYLFKILRDRISMFYTLSLVFALLTILQYDGYFYFLNLPVIFEKIKWVYPSLFAAFLFLFLELFSADENKNINIKKFTRPVKIFVVLAPLTYVFPFPVSLIADLGIPALVFITYLVIIIMTVYSYDSKSTPTKLILSAHITVCLGLTIHLLKEFKVIEPGFFVINAIKLGLTGQNMLITIAVLERFRINQEKATKTIHDNLVRIEIQNKELEIINSELEKLSIVASETDNSVAIYNSEGLLEWANTGFENLYGVKLEDIIKNKADRIEKIIPNRNIARYVSNCRDSRLPIVFETQVIVKDKREQWIQTTLSPYIRANKISKIIAIDSDITNLKIYEKELKTAKEKAVESDRLKTAFLGNLSHEIRTPLNGILGFSELLNRSELAEDEKKIYLEIIRSSGEQLMHIIDDIVDISLIESNQMKMFHTEFDLNILVTEIIDFFENYKLGINKGMIRLISDIQIPAPFRIKSDPFRLKQVLTNLVKNALKFTHEGYVRTGVYLKGDIIYFYVEDTGIGISPDKKDIIFQRFRQGEESLNRKYGGTGLGLSISKGIVEKLGGNIWLDMSYTKGFKILFTIPLDYIETGKINETHLKSRNLNDKIRNKNILIAEDHEVSYKYMEELLLPYKAHIDWAADGRKAVAMACENDYDLIIMDINLPEMNGIDAIREIRKTKPDVPILVQTAHAMESEIEPIIQSGCNDMIAKPFGEKDLIDKIIGIL